MCGLGGSVRWRWGTGDVRVSAVGDGFGRCFGVGAGVGMVGVQYASTTSGGAGAGNVETIETRRPFALVTLS